MGGQKGTLRIERIRVEAQTSCLWESVSAWAGRKVPWGVDEGFG